MKTISFVLLLLMSGFVYAGSCTRVGNSVICDDGTSYNQIGNTTVGSDGTTYNRIGNTTIRSDGTTYNQIGNTTVGSDGSTVNRVGNSYLINGPHGAATCSVIGNSTICN